MLNIGKLTAVDGANYYLRQVASGVEDYYTGQGEAVGYWTGSAAGELGLEGEVDGDDLRAVLAGRDPREPDEPLGSWKSGRKVLAFDVVLRAPKSVSVLWGLSDEATAGTIRAAFPTHQVYLPTLRPTLRLVTCGGPFDAASGHYRDNLVVFATLNG